MTRLIDADALCDRFSEMEDLNPIDGNNGYLHIEEIYEVIDNAPTEPQVIVFAENASKEEIEDFKQKLENVLERPQGEWEKPFEMNGKSYHKCTKCHISSELILIDNFCPNCGARMGGG